MIKGESNPYADDKGVPLVGKMREFFAWEWAQELERRKHLPAEEVARLERKDAFWIKKNEVWQK